MSILKAALIGKSLEHSISPEVHAELFKILSEKFETPWSSIEYLKVECDNESQMHEWIRLAHARGYRGANVTIPYKEFASGFGQDETEHIRIIRSANTLLFSNNLHVYSTDGDGFLYSLQKEYSDLNSKNYDLIILGAGGASRAILNVLQKLEWNSITIGIRSKKKSPDWLKKFPNVFLDEIHRKTGRCFIINATPVGLRSKELLLSDFDWRQGDIAVDLVYNPLQTQFLEHASERGASTIDGLGMLIEQAALSQFVWMMDTESPRSLLSVQEYKNARKLLASLLIPSWHDCVI